MTAWSALFCVIKGDTAQFEYISPAATTGLMNASLATGVPLTFGILTTYTDEQAIVRSRDDAHNKGREAAAACLDALSTLSKVAYPSFPDTLHCRPLHSRVSCSYRNPAQVCFA